MTKPQTTKRTVHPVADLFPMMTDEELAILAADIKANGLIHPIVVDKNGLLIDGRNRSIACEIAGIVPAVEVFEGDDPAAYIVASNVARRHMSKGQRAMAVAMVCPVPEKGGKGKRSRIQEGLDEPRKTFQNRLSQARIVFAYSPDLARAVLAGAKFLDAAYDEARKAKKPLDAQVAGKDRRKVARFKKGTSHEIDAPEKPPAEQHNLAGGSEKASAITPRSSACGHEDPKTTDGTVEIELGKVIARLRRDQPRNADTMRICDALERRLSGRN
jgi:hypothetical protein